ncbi:MAG: hypothetical protein AAFV33_01350 [Chloroflexota bacterium]
MTHIIQRPILHISLLAALLMMGGHVMAQITENSCPTGIESALRALDTSCAGTGRNEACYAVNQVIATFTADVDVESSTFDRPGAIVPVTSLETIRTLPLDTETGDWGVAVMRLQADLPATLPGQNVLFVLVGDTTVSNPASVNAVRGLDAPVAAVVNVDNVNLRSGPGTAFSVLELAASGDAIEIDGRNGTGTWLRGVYAERPVWIFANLVDYPEEIDVLPVLDDTASAPMQAFTISTGIGRPECEEAPNAMMVQTPQDTTVSLTINGARMLVGSTIVIDSPSPAELRIATLDGQAVVQAAEDAPQITIAAGQFSRFVEVMGEVPTPPEFTEPEPIEDADLEFYATFLDVDDDILNYDFEVPGFDEPPSDRDDDDDNEDEDEREGDDPFDEDNENEDEDDERSTIDPGDDDDEDDERSTIDPGDDDEEDDERSTIDPGDDDEEDDERSTIDPGDGDRTDKNDTDDTSTGTGNNSTGTSDDTDRNSSTGDGTGTNDSTGTNDGNTGTDDGTSTDDMDTTTNSNSR